MKRHIIQTRGFNKAINEFIAKNRLRDEDFQAFKKSLVENPEAGDLIPGTGGVRKVRLKSATKGKSGGFRVCYFDDPQREELFLLLLYQKNEQENLTAGEKKALKELTKTIKER